LARSNAASDASWRRLSDCVVTAMRSRRLTAETDGHEGGYESRIRVMTGRRLVESCVSLVVWINIAHGMRRAEQVDLAGMIFKSCDGLPRPDWNEPAPSPLFQNAQFHFQYRAARCFGSSIEFRRRPGRPAGHVHVGAAEHQETIRVVSAHAQVNNPSACDEIRSKEL